MKPIHPFSSCVNTITELFLYVADAADMDPCPLNWLPCEEQEHE